MMPDLGRCFLRAPIRPLAPIDPSGGLFDGRAAASPWEAAYDVRFPTRLTLRIPKEYSSPPQRDRPLRWAEYCEDLARCWLKVARLPTALHRIVLVGEVAAASIVYSSGRKMLASPPLGLSGPKNAATSNGHSEDSAANPSPVSAMRTAEPKSVAVLRMPRLRAARARGREGRRGGIA